MISIVIKGLATGLMLQLAVGPVFFFVVTIASRNSLIEGLWAVAGVAIVDYLYIFLSIFGVGKILEHEKVKKVMTAASAGVIVLFGVLMIMAVLHHGDMKARNVAGGGFTCFLSAFLLTLSSPITILFWTGLFAAKALEHGYTRKQLMVFGGGAGLSTVVFLGMTVEIVSHVRVHLPQGLLGLMNIPVGLGLIVYGVIRLVGCFHRGKRRAPAYTGIY